MLTILLFFIISINNITSASICNQNIAKTYSNILSKATSEKNLILDSFRDSINLSNIEDFILSIGECNNYGADLKLNFEIAKKLLEKSDDPTLGKQVLEKQLLLMDYFSAPVTNKVAEPRIMFLNKHGKPELGSPDILFYENEKSVKNNYFKRTWKKLVPKELPETLFRGISVKSNFKGSAKMQQNKTFLEFLNPINLIKQIFYIVIRFGSPITQSNRLHKSGLEKILGNIVNKGLEIKYASKYPTFHDSNMSGASIGGLPENLFDYQRAVYFADGFLHGLKYAENKLGLTPNLGKLPIIIRMDSKAYVDYVEKNADNFEPVHQQLVKKSNGELIDMPEWYATNDIPSSALIDFWVRLLDADGKPYYMQVKNMHYKPIVSE